MNEKKIEQLLNIDEIEIQPLSDEELESVAGGMIAPGDGSSGGCCSCSLCSATDVSK